MDDYIPQLLNKKTLDIINKNVILDINGVILIGNEYGLLNRIAQMIVKSMFHIDAIYVRPCLYNPMKEADGEFLFSEYHMEFDLNEKALEYIKSVITNRNISKRQFVFILKNAEPCLNRNLYLTLRRIIDINPTSKFIITTTSTSFMEKSLLSRLLPLNCNFPFDNIVKTDLLTTALTTMTDEQLYTAYVDCNFNIITLLQHISSNYKSLLWQQNVDRLCEIIKNEKKHINIIMLTREYVYKLFHIGVPLKDICKYVVKKNYNNTNIRDIIQCAADCEHGLTKGNKDILLYEKFFLTIYKLV